MVPAGEGRPVMRPGTVALARPRRYTAALAGLSPTNRAPGTRRIGTMTHERVPQRPRCRRLTGVRVVGTGSYLPDGVVTNDHLFQKFGFDSDWIVKRTGILERRHALPQQAT